MAVSYKKLFHMLIEKDMTPAQLQQKAGFSANIITRMKRNGYLSLDSDAWHSGLGRTSRSVWLPSFHALDRSVRLSD